MNVLHFLKSVCLFGLLSIGQASLLAEDLTTTSGRVLKNATVTNVVGDHLVIKHDGGSASVPVSELPPEIRRRYSAEQLFLELTQANAELAKVKAELAQAHAEIANSKANTQASGTKPATPTSAAVSSPGPAPVRIVPPLAELPALKPGDVVPVADIVAHYKADPFGADGRYKKKTFRLQGTVERFEEKMFVRNTDIVLETPEKLLRVVCNVPFADEFKAVFSRQSGQKLVGLTAGSERELLRVGESVIFQGKCAGLQNGAVVFHNCQRVR